MKQNRVIKRAILSVSDKTGIIEFASELRNLGIEHTHIIWLALAS